MALQSLLPLSSTNAGFNTPVTKMLGAFAAGLIAVVILLLSPLTSQSSQTTVNSSGYTTKQAPASNAASCAADKTQAGSSSTFSLMPGRLNRFLQ